MATTLEGKALEGTQRTKMELVEKGEDMYVLRSVIQPGGSIPEHSHQEASSYVVTAGKGQVTGSNARAVSQGDVVIIPAGKSHGWKSDKDELTIVGVFTGEYKAS